MYNDPMDQYMKSLHVYMRVFHCIDVVAKSHTYSLVGSLVLYIFFMHVCVYMSVCVCACFVCVRNVDSLDLISVYVYE